MSALPAASKTLFGCQPVEGTVGLMGFWKSFETCQLLSSSNEQITITLVTICQGWKTGWRCRSYLAPLETANLLPNGLQPTNVTARLIRNTGVGFYSNRPVSWEGV